MDALSLSSEGLRPSDSPTRPLARRGVGALRSRGSLATLARSLKRATGHREHLSRVEPAAVARRQIFVDLVAFQEASLCPLEHLFRGVRMRLRECLESH